MDQSAVKPIPAQTLKQDPLERKPGVFLGGLPPPSTAKRHADRAGRPSGDVAAFMQMLREMQTGAGKPFGTTEHEQTVAAPDIKPTDLKPIQSNVFPITEGIMGGMSLTPALTLEKPTTQPASIDEMFRRMMEQGPVPSGVVPQEVRQPKISPEEARAREALDQQKSASIVAEIVALYHTFGQQVELLAGAYRPETIINSGYQERTDTPTSVKSKREAQLAASRSKGIGERILSIFRGRQKQEAEQKASEETSIQQKIEQEKEARLAQIPDTGAKKPRGDLWGMFTEKGKRTKQAAQLLEPVKKSANIAMKFFNERFVAISAAFMRMLGGEHNPSNRVG